MKWFFTKLKTVKWVIGSVRIGNGNCIPKIKIVVFEREKMNVEIISNE